MRFDDLSAAVRHLRRHPRFTLLAALTLALGLGATITAFGLLSAVLLAPLPYPHAERLWAPRLRVKAAGQAAPSPSFFTYPGFLSFRRSQRVFDRVAAYVGNRLPLTGAPGPDRVAAEFVTPEYFPALGARPALGRLFATAASEAGMDAHSLLLSDRLWRRRFGADPAIVGRSVAVLGQSFTVLGVLPASFPGLLDDTELWFPLAALPALWDDPDALTASDFQQLRLVARARPGVSPGAVRGSVAAASRALPPIAGAETSTEAETLAESRRDPNLRRLLALLFAAAGAILLIACANVAGLQLARTAARRPELALRGALGATRRRVVAQALAESGLLAGLGGAAGLALAFLLLRALAALSLPDLAAWGLSGADLKNLVHAGLRPAVALFALLATLAAALLAGVVPAFAAASGDAGTLLRQGGAGGAGRAGGAGPGRRRGRRALVIAQTAMAVALLAVAGLLLQSLRGLLAIDPGFRARSVLLLPLESATLYGRERAPLFHRQLVEEVAKLPGAPAAALGACMPFQCRWTTTLGSVDGRSLSAAESPALGTQFVSPGYFRTLGIPLLAGRDFRWSDRSGAPRVVVVSRSLARRLWPHGSALGHRLNRAEDLPLKEPEAEVVGVVGDVRFRSLAAPSPGDLYFADAQTGAAWGVLFVPATQAPSALVPALRRALRRVDPNLPFVDGGTVGERLSRASSRSRLAAALLSVLAAAALFLTLVAVYGGVAQTVVLRRRELAVRVALGAGRGRLLGLVLRQGLGPVLAGLALGVPLAWGAGRWLEALLYGARGIAPAVHLAVLLLVVAAATLACLLPARRALAADPAVSLRQE